MSATVQTVQAKSPAQQTLMYRNIHRFFSLLTGLLFALIFSIIIEWVGMVLWWPNEGVKHSENMLTHEIGYLNKDFEQSIVSSNPAKFAEDMADKVYEYGYIKSGLIDFFKWVEMPKQKNDSSTRLTIKAIFEPIAKYISAAVIMTQLFAVRLAVLILSMPAFILFGVVGMTDGLVERDLRRWGGGRESAFVYHWAKRPIFGVFLAAWVVYLGLPITIPPNYIILPFAALFGTLISITSSKFKKYL